MKEMQEFEQVEREHMNGSGALRYFDEKTRDIVKAEDYDALLAYTKVKIKELESPILGDEDFNSLLAAVKLILPYGVKCSSPTCQVQKCQDWKKFYDVVNPIIDNSTKEIDSMTTVMKLPEKPLELLESNKKIESLQSELEVEKKRSLGHQAEIDRLRNAYASIVRQSRLDPRAKLAIAVLKERAESSTIDNTEQQGLLDAAKYLEETLSKG